VALRVTGCEQATQSQSPGNNPCAQEAAKVHEQPCPFLAQ
jgi:hypothetical protein